MSVRPLLLAALALGFASGCSKPPPPTTNPPSEPGSTAPTTEMKPAEAAPSGNEPGTDLAAPAAGGGQDAKKGETAQYIVRNSGVRCITTPCPYFNAFRVDKPDLDAIPVHELDLSAVTGGSEERQSSLLQQTDVGAGLKVEGTLETRPNAGPAGAATVLRVSKTG